MTSSMSLIIFIVVVLSIAYFVKISTGSPSISEFEQSNQNHESIKSKMMKIPGDMNESTYSLNVTALNYLWHSMAINGLLKAKGRSLAANQSSLTERIAYRQCIEDSQYRTNRIAACVVQLMNARDYQRQQQARTKFLSWIMAHKLPKTSNEQSQQQQQHFPDLSNDLYRRPSNILPIKPTTYYHHRRPTTNYHPYRSPQSPTIGRKRRATISEQPQLSLAKLAVQYFRTYYGNLNDTLSSTRIATSTIRKTGHNGTSRIDQLKRLSEYYDKIGRYNAFQKRMTDQNSRFFDENNLPLENVIEKKPDANDNSMLKKIVDTINHILPDEYKITSILSPKFFPIFADKKNTKRQKLLSPTLFSFHENDGFLSLPNLLKTVSGDSLIDRDEWLDLVMEISGASRQIDQLIDNLEPEMHHFEQNQWPALQKLESLERNWNQLLETYTQQQKTDIAQRGYTFLDTNQLDMIYNDNDLSGHNRTKRSIKQFGLMNDAERDAILESDIRKLAALHAAPAAITGQEKTIDSHSGAHDGTLGLETLQPFAFTNYINHPVALGAITLSPHAFVSEILAPHALVASTLSPRAFIAAVLSPSAFITRVLSPSAFRLELLSPRAFTALVLSPEAFLGEILSPCAFEPRVLSPETLVLDVLSPQAISPHVLSPENLRILVLSPNILSPRVLSGENLILEVLSPHLLGGDESGEEAEKESHIASDEHGGHSTRSAEHEGQSVEEQDKHDQFDNEHDRIIDQNELNSSGVHRRPKTQLELDGDQATPPPYPFLQRTNTNAQYYSNR